MEAGAWVGPFVRIRRGDPGGGGMDDWGCAWGRGGSSGCGNRLGILNVGDWESLQLSWLLS